MSNAVDADVLLREIYNSTFDYCLITIDLAGRITSWNAGAERIIGYAAEEVLGKDISLIFTPEDCARNLPRQEVEIGLITGRAEDYRWHLRKDGSRFWADGVLTPIHDATGRHSGYLKIFRDITERKLAQEEVHRVANRDLLTGIDNRHSLEKRAGELIAIAMRSAQQMALHLVDLDHFKHVNDTLGHQAGDMLLQQVSRRMRGVLRESDFLARLGGDEFVIMQPNMPSLEAAGELASKLITLLSQPFSIAGHEVLIGCSIGIALCPHDAGDLDLLMKKADLALYRAKAEGKGKFHYFTDELDLAVHRKSGEIAALREAVANSDFRLEYQPKVNTLTGQILGVEAFLRCTHPALTNYRIEQIFFLAAEAGITKDLSMWVLRESCAQMHEWKTAGLPGLKMSINLSSRDLTDPDTPSRIDAVIAGTAVKPSDLEIELKEGQAAAIEKSGLAVLHALRSRGIGIALDDFGSGRSALSHLRHFPVTAVKLDKDFLLSIPHDEQGSAFIRAITDLARALGLEVSAEGVETDEEATFLRENACVVFQGYLISRPLPAGAMTAWLAGKHDAPTGERLR